MTTKMLHKACKFSKTSSKNGFCSTTTGNERHETMTTKWFWLSNTGGECNACTSNRKQQMCSVVANKDVILAAMKVTSSHFIFGSRGASTNLELFYCLAILVHITDHEHRSFTNDGTKDKSHDQAIPTPVPSPSPPAHSPVELTVKVSMCSYRWR